MNKKIIQNFIDGQYERIICEKCLNTFMTNVYYYSPTQVLLEKRELGLEYFCHATHTLELSSVPDVISLGIIDEDNHIIPSESRDKLFTTSETDFRYLYLMERMEHLDQEEAQFFDNCIQQLDKLDNKTQNLGFSTLADKHGEILRNDIHKLFDYSQQHKEFILWDLHGDNLMRRANGQLVILDPFTLVI